MAYSRMTLLNGEKRVNDLVEWRRTRVAVLLSFTKLVERFDEALYFVVKPFFPYEVTFGFSP